MIRKILLALAVVACAGAGVAIAQQGSIKRTPPQKIEFPEGGKAPKVLGVYVVDKTKPLASPAP